MTGRTSGGSIAEGSVPKRKDGKGGRRRENKRGEGAGFYSVAKPDRGQYAASGSPQIRGLDSKRKVLTYLILIFLTHDQRMNAFHGDCRVINAELYIHGKKQRTPPFPVPFVFPKQDGVLPPQPDPG